jgi:hypothetical protein
MRICVIDQTFFSVCFAQKESLVEKTSCLNCLKERVVD